MFLSILGALAALLVFYQYLVKPKLYWKHKNVKQLFAVPILGDNWRFFFKMDSIENYIRKIHMKFKDERYYGVYQGLGPTLALRDPELIKQIGVKDFDHFLNHQQFGEPGDDNELFNKNLFALKGDAWREMRATLSPTFTTSKMRAMFTLMKQSGEQYVNFYLKQKEDLIELEVKESSTRFTNDVIANCAFGIGCDSLNEPDNEFYLNGKNLTNFSGFWSLMRIMIFILLPKLASLLKISPFPAYLGVYFKKLVRSSIDHREKHNIVRPDMINLLMEAKRGKLKYDEDTKNTKSAGFATVEESQVGRVQKSGKLTEMTDMDMAAQAIIFFLAGFETVSVVMTFMCYALATNPDVQEKLCEEVDETFEATQGNLTYDTLARMKYMDMVLTETLRKHPPVPAIDRECTKPYTIPAEREGESAIHLKVGDLIWFPVYGLHYDPDNYPEPDRFIPERFSDENKGNVKPYTFLPFGVGPRNCIGSRFAIMEIKILFYHILRKFEIVPIKKTTIPLKLKKGSFNPLLEGGCWVGYKKRN